MSSNLRVGQGVTDCRGKEGVVVYIDCIFPIVRYDETHFVKYIEKTDITANGQFFIIQHNGACNKCHGAGEIYSGYHTHPDTCAKGKYEPIMHKCRYCGETGYNLSISKIFET